MVGGKQSRRNVGPSNGVGGTGYKDGVPGPERRRVGRPHPIVDEDGTDRSLDDGTVVKEGVRVGGHTEYSGSAP